MKLILHNILLGFCLAVVNSEFLSDLKSGLLKYLVSAAFRPEEGVENGQLNDLVKKRHNLEPRIDKLEDYDIAKQKKKNEDWAGKQGFNIKVPMQNYDGNTSEAEIITEPTFNARYRKGDEVDQIVPGTQSQKQSAKEISKNYFHMDPVLNSLRRHPNAVYESNSKLQPKYRLKPDFKNMIDFRRRKKKDSDSDSASSSSSREMKDFKEEFRELWLQKKFEAINQSRVHGDKVNMVAARPWGVPCGDPNQHDMPWGVCMLHIECEPEFRVYRGDLFCGRTQFVCCALQLTTYDMYQGFDVSFDDKSLSTDSDEKKEQGKTSKEKRKQKKARERKRRRKAREKRKKKIRKHIKKIVKEIRKILNKQYRNGTRQRKKRTKQLKKFIKDLKKQYRKDRQSVKDLHENDMLHIDTALMERLKQIQKVNHHFASNKTFREVVLKGTMTKKVARMLLDAYPELDEFLEARRAGGGELRRRAGGGQLDSDEEEDLEYDVEYGYLYY